jgi:DNA polymerase V
VKLNPIREAAATYMQRAAEKLRAQHSLCEKIRVSIRTGMFNPDEAKYANGALVELPYPTNDMRLMTKAAIQALDRLFRPGYRYSKAEVLLMDLRQPGEFTDDLFAEVQPATADCIMGVLDEINERWGRGTLRAARCQCAGGSGLGDASRAHEPEFHHPPRSVVDCKGELIDSRYKMYWAQTSQKCTST